METLNTLKQQLRALPLLQRVSLEIWLQALNAPPPQGCVAEAKPAYDTDEPVFMSFDAYLQLEEKTSTKHEFVNGFVFAMSEASLAHVAVTGNLTFALRSRLRRGPCAVFTSDARVRIREEGNEISYYPDLVIDCRPDTRETYFVRSPTLVAEVLSPSTHVTDRREKLQHYSLIGSLEEYVLAAQDECKVVVYRRANDWRPHVYAGPDAVAEFVSLQCAVPLAEIYADIPGLPRQSPPLT
jgi:Uma2 family endonuclease